MLETKRINNLGVSQKSTKQLLLQKGVPDPKLYYQANFTKMVSSFIPHVNCCWLCSGLSDPGGRGWSNAESMAQILGGMQAISFI